MTEAEIAFNSIADTLCQKPDTTLGKMMSSPGIQKKGKVFAFFWKDKMVFKLGKDFDISDKFGIMDFEYLNPFKNKPPMKGWYVVNENHIRHWKALADVASDQMK